ncbi:MAG: GNAT family N-acetyltransferase [Thermodesulfovibrionales bacterium]
MSDLQLLETHGFYTVDVGAVWGRKTAAFPEQPHTIKEAMARDVRRLTAMSAGLFRDSRFYNDPFFTAEEADRLYRAWIRNSVSNSLREEICRTFFIKDSGFLVYRQKANCGDIALIGVVPEKQGRGIGRSLVLHTLSRLREDGMDTLTVRTQIKNIRAMNFYLGLGFKIQYTDTTMARVIDA